MSAVKYFLFDWLTRDCRAKLFIFDRVLMTLLQSVHLTRYISAHNASEESQEDTHIETISRYMLNRMVRVEVWYGPYFYNK